MQRRVRRGRAPCARRPGVVHEGQRLDQGEVEALGSDPSTTATRRAVRPAAGPAGAVGERGPAPSSRRCGASPRTATPGFPRPTMTFTDSARHARMWPESRPARRDGRPIPAGRAARGWYPPHGPVARGRSGEPSDAVSRPASRPPRRVRRDPSRRRGASPWTTRRRSSSAARPATSPVWPPRPLDACSVGALDGHDDVTEMQARPGGRRERAGRSWAIRGCAGDPCTRWAGNGSGGQQRERQDVRRAGLAHVRRVQLGELGIVRQDQPDRRRGGARARVERGGDDARQGRAAQPGREHARAGRSRSIRHGRT